MFKLLGFYRLLMDIDMSIKLGCLFGVGKVFLGRRMKSHFV